jgi:sterol desaturase/sphingolipid hydroxylase (fatty acid hydroxylase superfamily)
MAGIEAASCKTMSESPEPTSASAASAQSSPPAGDAVHKPYWLYRLAAWVMIVAGIVFIVGAIFFSGVYFSHGGWHGHRGHHHPMCHESHHNGPGPAAPGPGRRAPGEVP